MLDPGNGVGSKQCLLKIRPLEGQKMVATTDASIEHLGKSIETPLADPKSVGGFIEFNSSPNLNPIVTIMITECRSRPTSPRGG